MSCKRFGTLVALWVEGDLPDAKARRVERHVAACGDCRKLSERLRESQGALKALRAEPVDAAVYAALRRRVLEQVSAARPLRPAFPRRWAAAGAAAVLAVAGAWLYWQTPLPAPPRPPILAERPKPPTPPSPVVKAPARAAARRAPGRPRGRAVPPARPESVPAAPMVVRLETADPDVVIYWIFDTAGE